MAPKKAKAKGTTATAPARRSRRLADANAVASQPSATNTGTAPLNGDDPEKILRDARQAQRRKRGGVRAPSGRGSESRERSSERGNRRRNDGSADRSSEAQSGRQAHHETGQLHLPSAGQPSEPNRTEEASGATTPVPATEPPQEERPNGLNASTAAAVQAPLSDQAQERIKHPLERLFELQKGTLGPSPADSHGTTRSRAFYSPPLRRSDDGEAEISPRTRPDDFATSPTQSDVKRTNHAREVLMDIEERYKQTTGDNQPTITPETVPEKRQSQEPPQGESDRKKQKMTEDKAAEKRRSEEPAPGESALKKQKTAQEKDQPGPETASRPPPQPSSNPCQDFQISLRKLRRALFDFTEELEVPVVIGRWLYQETLFCAIASITEAIFSNGGPATALVDPMITGSTAAQRVARPGETLYWPYVTGGQPDPAFRTRGGHLGLFIFERATRDGSRSARIDVQRYDSSAQPDEDRTNVAYVEARNILFRRGWTADDAGIARDDFPRYPEARLAPTQRQDWVCGLHAIFTAWAHALGLRLNPEGRMRQSFEQEATEMVNLALRGHMDSNTIRNFLACYNFIDRASVVPPERTFRAARPFLTVRQLSHHVARVRLEEELQELRRRNPSTPNLCTALEVIREIRGSIQEDNLVTWDGEDVVREYEENSRLLTDPHFRASTQPGSASGPGPDQVGLDKSNDGREARERYRASDTSIQEAIRREILDSNIDISGLEPEEQQLLIEVPLDSLDQVREIIALLPRRGEDAQKADGAPIEEPIQSRNEQGEDERPAGANLLPGLGYDLDGLPTSNHAPYPAEEVASPDLPTPPHPGNSSTPGYAEDDEEDEGKSLYAPPPMPPRRLPSPYEHETPGRLDEAELTDYGDSNLEEDAYDAFAQPSATPVLQYDDFVDGKGEDEALDRELFGDGEVED